MIKRILTAAFAVLSALAFSATNAAGQAQPNRFPPINLVAGDPTGTACPAHSMVQSSDSGILYTCQGGAYHTAGGQTIPVTAVTWPPSCTSGTYVPATNTCVPTGTAANPGGSPGQTQINAGGSTFIGIPGSVTDVTNGWKTQGGLQYAKGWQSGGGNNGIANASTLNSTVIADPSYANTEYFSAIGTAGHSWAMGVDQAHVHDIRNGQITDTYTSPFQTLLDATNSGQTIHMYTTNIPSGNPTFGKFYPLNIHFEALSSGIDNGSSPKGQTSWTLGGAVYIQQTVATQGLFGAINAISYKTGIGDTANYFYNTSDGGAVAGSDEGNHALAYKANESAFAFHGTVVAGGGGTAATTIKTLCTQDCSLYGDPNSGGGGPGDGRFLVDTSANPDSGNIISATTPGATLPGVLNIDHSITPSTAIGSMNGDCNTGFEPYPFGNSYTSATCSVTVTSGAFAVGPGLVCFGGIWHEQTLITNITGTGPYTLSMKLRRPHRSGDWIGQGGPCGQYINLTPNDQGVGAATLHYPLELVGAPDATHLYYQFFFLGASQLGSAGLGNLFNGQFPATSLTNAGGTVYITGNAATNSNAYALIGNTLWFSGTSPSTAAYEATPCTNAQWNTSMAVLTCTQAGSIGAGVVGANVSAGTSRFGNAGYVTWYGGQTMDVLDHSVSPPVLFSPTGGVTFTLEPNIGVWPDSGTVEQPHHYAQRMNGFYGGSAISNPMTSNTNGATISMAGGGAAGGSDTSTTNSMSILSLVNPSGSGIYQYHGGFRTPPGGVTLYNGGAGSGLFKWGLNMQAAPDPAGSSVLYVGCPLSGCTDPNYFYNLANLTGNGSNGSFQYHPFSNTWQISGNVNYANATFGKATYVDVLAFAPLAATGFTATAVASGGTLADSTSYCYVMVAGNNAGTGTYTVEKCATTGTSGGRNSVKIAWNRVQGAIHYYFYGRATGAEKFCTSIDNNLLATQWIDNGSLPCTTGGVVTPPVDTTRGYIDQAANVGLNSAGTAFELKLQAPANMAATATITVTKISTVSITPAATTASSCVEQTFNTYTGLATGQVVNVSPPAALGAHIWIGSTRVSAANTLAISFCADATAGTPAAGAYLAVAF